jgi:hypothetical protein
MLKQNNINYAGKVPNETSDIKNFQGTNQTSFRGQGTLTSFVKSQIQSNFSGSYVKVFNK